MANKKSKQIVSVYQLKAVLKDSRPPIWRRILVPAAITFSQLHKVFQVVMDWENYHLHQFVVGETIVGSRDLFFDEAGKADILNETRTHLEQLFPEPPANFTYEYDFGDDWELMVTIEKRMDPDPTIPYPLCLEGRMASPPEDVGGVWGYYDMLHILGDRKHPDWRSVSDCLGGEFDPKRFDKETVNAQLRRMKW